MAKVWILRELDGDSGRPLNQLPKVFLTQSSAEVYARTLRKYKDLVDIVETDLIADASIPIAADKQRAKEKALAKLSEDDKRALGLC